MDGEKYGQAELEFEVPVTRRQLLEGLGFEIKTHTVGKVRVYDNETGKSWAIGNQIALNVMEYIAEMNRVLAMNGSKYSLTQEETDRSMYLDAEKRLEDRYFLGHKLEIVVESPLHQTTRLMRVNWLSDIPQEDKEKLVNAFWFAVRKALGIRFKADNCMISCKIMNAKINKWESQKQL